MISLNSKHKLCRLLFLIVINIGLITPHETRSDSGANLFANSSQRYEDVIVERVIRADRILLATGEKIRLIGIRAPDLPQREKVERNEYGFIIEPPVTPETTLEEQALRFVKELLENKRVRLEFDKRRTDDNLETLAYVFLSDGTMANVEILRQGFAYLQIEPPNFKYEDLFRAAYREARQEKRGLQAD